MRSVVLLSGGVDSAVVLAHAVHREGSGQVTAVTFNYGQNQARQEELAATALAAHYGVNHRKVDLGPLFGPSALTGQLEVPDGHAESPDATEVPGRNLVLLSVAAAMADGMGAVSMGFGANAADAAGYPDCRPPFVEFLRNAIELGTRHHVHLHAPLLHLDKAEIVSAGRGLGVPFELTWSCYSPVVAAGTDRDLPCERCGACDSRTVAGL